MFIYVITNKVTGKIYIGQHKGNNLKKYLQDKFSQAKYELKRKGHGRGSHLFASMRKHPKEVWSIEPLFEGIETKEELDRLERLLIALYDTRNPKVGYNICKGGEGFTGTHSDEWKQKMRAKMLGRTFSPEAIAKMKAHIPTSSQLANLKRARDLETIEKVKKTKRQKGPSIKHMENWKKILATKHNNGLPKGYTHSEATRKKLSVSLKGRKAPNIIDMSGQTINGIAVLERAESTKKGLARWYCKCFCGNFFTTSGSVLRKKSIKSCGCV